MHEQMATYMLKVDPQEAVVALGEALDADPDPAASLLVTYYDTFDWRLFRKGFALRREKQENGTAETQLCRLSGEVVYQQELDEVPGFAWEFPDSPLQEKLEKILRVRRLLPAVEVRLRRQRLSLRDDEGKRRGTASVVWSGDRRQDQSSPGVAPFVQIQGLRGYEETFARLAEAVESHLLGDPGEVGELELVTREAERVPGDYSSRLNVELYPEMPAGDASRTILRVLLDTMEVNRQGVLEDLDSEFLHDFRVAVRRTRSLLSLMKDTLASESVPRFADEFAWLGRVTGPVRDLDVYGLKMRGYRKELPRSVRQQLEPLQDFLGRRRQVEQRKLVRSLRSQRYEKLVRKWRAFLDHAAEETAEESRRPVRLVASEKIMEAHRKVLKRGYKLETKPTPARFHRLRIECKKLRYLLEFFRSLYDPELRKVVKSLKRLQDILGDFNDFQVQQEKLEEFAEQMLAEGKTPALTYLAMGRLVEILEKGQSQEQSQFHREFESFKEEKNQRRLERILGMGTP